MQYSALAQINSANVAALEPAWFYPRRRATPTGSVFNPLIVDDVMYVAGAKGVVVALDAATGKELWTSTERGDRARDHLLGERGPHRSPADSHREQRHSRDRCEDRPS